MNPLVSAPALLLRIDHYLNSAWAPHCDLEEVCPFTLFFRRGTDFPYLSYARPTAPLAGNLQPAIAEVRAAFAQRGRACRWEFIEELSPALAAALVAAGFPEPSRRPLMAVTAARFRPAPVAGVTIRPVGPLDDLAAVTTVQQRAFGVGDGPPSPEDLADTRLSLERGMRLFAVWVNEAPVAAGVHTPVEGVTELAGIATLTEFRRRGLGAALTAALVEDALSMGCDTIFLSAGDEGIARVYARVGFELVGTALDTMEGEDPWTGTS